MHRVLFPDAGHLPDLTLEAALAGAEAELRRFDVARASDIPDEDWQAADAVIVYRVPLGAEIASKLKRCRIVVRGGVGYDSVDVKAFGARGIPVCNIPDYGTTDVADSAIAMVLALARGTATYNEALRDDPVGLWDHRAARVRRLRGARFGVVGLGRIGLACARRAAGLDMDVGFFDPHLPPGADLATGFRRYDSLAALLGDCEVVSIHAPLTPETRGLIDARAVAAMRPGMLLVNTARGPVVDLDALLDGLRSERIWAAGLDVLPQEPPDPAHPLLAAWRKKESWIKGRLILTPHAAFYSAESIADIRRKGMETVMLRLREGKLRSCVNQDFLKA